MRYIICKRYTEGLCAPSEVFDTLDEALDQLHKDYIMDLKDYKNMTIVENTFDHVGRCYFIRAYDLYDEFVEESIFPIEE